MYPDRMSCQTRVQKDYMCVHTYKKEEEKKKDRNENKSKIDMYM